MENTPTVLAFKKQSSEKVARRKRKVYYVHTHTHTTPIILLENPPSKRIKGVSIKMISRLAAELQLLLIHEEGKNELWH